MRTSKTSDAVAKTCAAIEDMRLSRAATPHAIEQSRKSFSETRVLLIKLRLIYSGYNCRRSDSTYSSRRVASEFAALRATLAEDEP
jgi:hypothetical protein